MTLRACGYLRVSSADQARSKTIDGQRRDVKAYILSMGWEFVGFYEDDGRSAWTGKLEARDGYARMLVDAKAKRFDVVVAVAVDRFTRSEDPIERATVTGAIAKAGAQIAIVGAGIQDPRTLAGDLYLTVMALIAAQESRIKSYRTLSGKQRAAELGRNPGGKAPFGLRYRVADHTWHVDGAQAEAIHEAFERVALGEPPKHVADDFDRRGVATDQGGRWTGNSIGRMIRSDAYLGRWTVSVRRKLTVNVPVIIDSDTAAAARGVMAARYRKPSPRQAYHHLLTGLATCGLCGAAIGVGDTGIRPHRLHVPAYRCVHRRRAPKGQAPCALPLLLIEDTDERIWAELVDAIADPRVMDRILAADRDQAQTADPAIPRAELDRLAAAMDSVLAQAADGAVPQDVADAQIARLAGKRKRAQAELADALAAARGLRGASAADDVAAAIEAFRLAAPSADGAMRREMVRLAVARAVIAPGVVALDLRFDATTRAAGPVRPDLNMPDLPVRQGLRILGVTAPSTKLPLRWTQKRPRAA